MIFDVFHQKNTSYHHQKRKNMFRDIMLNQYGNYTISTIMHKAFEYPNKKYIKFFLKVFRENTDNLKKVNFGKKFINKIDLMTQLQE